MNDDTKEQSKHNFSFGTITNFDAHIDESIPHYSTMNNNIVSMSDYFIDEGTNVYDIGCSTGKLLRRLKENRDNTQFIGLEINENFTKDFKQEKNLTLMQKNLLEFDDFHNASLITSVFTLQFIQQKDRQAVLQNIYNGLNKGGAFIFSEKVISKYSKLQDIFTFLYYDFKKNNFTADEILNKEVDLRSIMKPSTIEDNFTMLREVGFKEFDVVWRNFNFLSIVAIK
jgi:tRNA (cmo5U34)-methyltransferase